MRGRKSSRRRRCRAKPLLHSQPLRLVRVQVFLRRVPERWRGRAPWQDPERWLALVLVRHNKRDRCSHLVRRLSSRRLRAFVQRLR